MRRRIAASIVLVAVCVATLRACPTSEDSPKPDEEQQVRARLARFAAASAQRDYTAVCKDLLADALTAKIRSVGVPCEAAVRTGLSEVRQPTLTVTSVRVQGAAATAVVRSTAAGQKPSTDLVRLVKERGGWRVASLAEPRRARAGPPRRPVAKGPAASGPAPKGPGASGPAKGPGASGPAKGPAANGPAPKGPADRRPPAERAPAERPPAR